MEGEASKLRPNRCLQQNRLSMLTCPTIRTRNQEKALIGWINNKVLTDNRSCLAQGTIFNIL